MDFVKSAIEHREPVIVGFFIQLYDKLRKFELYYIYFDEFCDNNKFEELKMDSLYLALAEEDLDEYILLSKPAEWIEMRSKDCRDSFKADGKINFFPRSCCSEHKKHEKREQVLFKEEFRCSEIVCLCIKTYCCYDSEKQKYKFSSKGLNKRSLEDFGDVPMAKYRRELDTALSLKSTNKGF